jgi:capsule polysaccharide export protein KpsE/RkpR
VGKLNTANTQIAELTANITNLESQLRTEKDNVSNLQSELNMEKADLIDLQAELTSTEVDLTASKAKVVSLTSELAIANENVATIQANLDKANLDLATAIATNTAQADILKKVQDPRHFNSFTELTTWLANDDTNTNPTYSSLTPQARSYVLEIKALRDGYLLSACLDWDSTYIYTWNVAVINGGIYSVDAATDVITQGPTITGSMPLHPLPLP